MKRLSYFAMTALLTAGLSVPAFSQGKGPDKTPAKTAPCAAERADVKAAGKTSGAAKAKAALKACTDNAKASAVAAKKKK